MTIFVMTYKKMNIYVEKDSFFCDADDSSKYSSLKSMKKHIDELNKVIDIEPFKAIVSEPVEDSQFGNDKLKVVEIVSKQHDKYLDKDGEEYYSDELFLWNAARESTMTRYNESIDKLEKDNLDVKERYDKESDALEKRNSEAYEIMGKFEHKKAIDEDDEQ